LAIKTLPVALPPVHLQLHPPTPLPTGSFSYFSLVFVFATFNGFREICKICACRQTFNFIGKLVEFFGSAYFYILCEKVWGCTNISKIINIAKLKEIIDFDKIVFMSAKIIFKI